jgi:hypothetical protein
MVRKIKKLLSSHFSLGFLVETYRFVALETKIRKVFVFFSMFFLAGALLETYNFICAETSTGKFDSTLGWTNLRGRTYEKGVQYSVNGDGFRMGKVDRKKSKIVVLGDSIGFGPGVNDEYVFSYLLDQLLPNYQVLNLSVIGYGLGQYFLLLKREIDRLNPRLVIVIICTGNDIMNTVMAENYGLSKPLFYLGRKGLELSRGNVSRFSCNNMFAYSWFLKQKFFAWMKKYCATHSLPIENRENVISEILRQIDDLGKKRGVKTLFLLSPSKSNFDEKKAFLNFIEAARKNNPKNYMKAWFDSPEYSFSKTIAFFRNFFESSGLTYMDYQREIESRGLDYESLFLDNYHYSPRGHKLLGEKIRDFALDKNMLKKVDL